MNDYTTFSHEAFEKFEVITTRKMFGGYAAYHDDMMFSLVTDNELFLKADKKTMNEFEK